MTSAGFGYTEDGRAERSDIPVPLVLPLSMANIPACGFEWSLHPAVHPAQIGPQPTE